MHRDHEDALSPIDPQDLASGADSVEAGHGHVHEHQIGLMLSDESDGVLAIGGLGDHVVSDRLQME
jgi:hypothetical protein